jgi:hypothetical protein
LPTSPEVVPHRQQRCQAGRARLRAACVAATLALAGLVSAGCVVPVAAGGAGSGAASTESSETSENVGSGRAGDSVAGSSDGRDEDQGEAPRDQVLSIEMVHPNGMTLSLSKSTFSGGDIFIDVELINSSRYAVTIHLGNVTSNRLRLVDDAGHEYNFVEPDEDKPVISLVSGETLKGRLAFRGPLRGEPKRLSLVMNLSPEEIAGYNLEDESDTTRYPAFVVPIDLVRT